jgi:hypothetical protein
VYEKLAKAENAFGLSAQTRWENQNCFGPYLILVKRL